MGVARSDVLTHNTDLLQSAAVLGARFRHCYANITAGAESMTVLAANCGNQIHEHRCSKEIVLVAGDLLPSETPAGKLVPQQRNPGAVLGATTGALRALLGSNNGAGSALVAGGLGGYIGWQGGGAIFNAAQARACIQRQKQLDAMSTNMTGHVPNLSLAVLQQLIVDNVQRGTISSKDADTVIREANNLSKERCRLSRPCPERSACPRAALPAERRGHRFIARAVSRRHHVGGRLVCAKCDLLGLVRGEHFAVSCPGETIAGARSRDVHHVDLEMRLRACERRRNGARILAPAAFLTV